MPSTRFWSSRFAFILTSAAFAIGLGNIWRFPYIAGENGGGAFLLMYILLVLVVGIPLLTIELALGRMAGITPLVGFYRLTGKRVTNLVGWLGILGNFLIMWFYVMVLAWILVYFGESLTGELARKTAEELPAHFGAITGNLPLIIGLNFGILFLTWLVVRRGLQQGLERYSRYMMIGLMTMLLGLTIWAATLDGAMEAYRWYLTPDFSRLSPKTLVLGMGQMCFSVGVGMGISFVFGSYTGRAEHLLSSAAWIAGLDTLIAIIAGLMIFPILFTFGLSPEAGPNLVFISLASVFGQWSFGGVLGAIFFLLLFFSGFTSLIASVQGLKDTVHDRFGWSESSSLLVIVGSIFLGSVPVVFSFADPPWQVAGRTVFTAVDTLASTIMLPLSALLLGLMAAYIIGYNRLRDNLDAGTVSGKIGNRARWLVAIVLPIALVLIFLSGFWSGH